MTLGRLAVDLTPKVALVLRNVRKYHCQYYAVKTFGGPSLYFHRRALGKNGRVSSRDRLELIYAVLSSWGMHRMGPGGSKMQPFATFNASVNSVKKSLVALMGKRPSSLSAARWKHLEAVFRGIDVMASGTTLVGNSKVMAHLIPGLVAPIDRQYTLKFLFGNSFVRNGLQKEWLLLRKILEEFFYPVVADLKFSSLAASWIASPKFPWDTSLLKVVDNLVIGSFK